MFNKSLSDNGAVGVYKSVISSTCCYCGDEVPEDDLATFLLSKHPSSEEGDDQEENNLKLFIVEVHVKCTIDMANELSQIIVSSLNYGDKVTSSATIVYGRISSQVECVICKNTPNGEEDAIVFSSTEINAEEIDKNVWCHPNCLSDICDSMKNIEGHLDEIVAEEI